VIQPADRLSAYVASAIVVLTPLLFNPYSRRVFEPEKAVALRIVGVLCIAGWIVAALSARSQPAAERPVPLWRWRVAVAWWPIVGLTLVLLAATAGSVSPRTSWAGSYEWRQGAVTFLACLALFVTAARSFPTATGLTRLVGLMEATSVVVAAYGISQYCGWNPLPWTRTIEGRAFSSLGHPNFLAAYLVLIIPVAVARMATSAAASRAWGLHLAVVGVDALSLLLTFSRSGWLGLSVAAACFGWLHVRGGAANSLVRRGRWVAGVVVAGLALFMLTAFLDPHGWFSYSPLEPIHSFLRGKSATAQVRIAIWNGALHAIRTRPWLGYGPETFRLSFPPVYPSALSLYGGVTAAGDHAHNEWLDWGLSTGLLGLAAYLWLVVAAFRRAARSLPRIAAPSLRWLQIGLIAGAAGYLAQNQLSFGTIAPLAHFWLFLGLMVALAQPAGAEPVTSGVAPIRLDGRRSRVGALIAAAFVAIATYFVLWPDIKSLAADVLVAKAQLASETGDWLTVLGLYDQAIRLAPATDRYLAWQAEAYDALAVEQNKASAFAQGEERLQQALELAPGDVAYWTSLGTLYYDWGVGARDAERLNAAVEAFRRASILSPTDPDIYTHWGRTYHALKQYDAALASYREALALDPLNVQGYTYMGEAYLAMGQLGAAREMYDRVDEVTETIDRLVAKR
jgi:O-antigen ligase